MLAHFVRLISDATYANQSQLMVLPGRAAVVEALELVELAYLPLSLQTSMGDQAELLCLVSRSWKKPPALRRLHPLSNPSDRRPGHKKARAFLQEWPLAPWMPEAITEDLRRQHSWPAQANAKVLVWAAGAGVGVGWIRAAGLFACVLCGSGMGEQMFTEVDRLSSAMRPGAPVSVADLHTALLAAADDVSLAQLPCVFPGYSYTSVRFCRSLACCSLPSLQRKRGVGAWMDSPADWQLLSNMSKDVKQKVELLDLTSHENALAARDMLQEELRDAEQRIGLPDLVCLICLAGNPSPYLAPS